MNILSVQAPALSNNSSLAGKTVLVFGGTSGIGLATAVQARDAGAEVIVVGSDPARSAAAAAEHGLQWRAADITDRQALAVELQDIGHVDHLVLMAGSFVVGKILEADTTYLRRAFDERIWAAIDVIRALHERLDAHASVTFISGVLADRPNAQGTAVPAAASAAMEALARGLALELAPRRFNTLSPGTTDTPLLGRTLGSARGGYVAELSEKLPLKKIVSVRQAAAAVMFLIRNDFMNGETLHIDGGQRLV
ncbi:SDR family oxidoreductase [Bordetella sp. N]|uniref:SDR family oxidoreductase n=1 Tax=Bordetella sp. N TaxID=1746199 RepID=UPI00070B95B2|nr:SDR family oxidoreductase [Bordetella sp. N]ALM85971.1 short-chain dehydrogenase [Bordetella sp. N]